MIELLFICYYVLALPPICSEQLQESSTLEILSDTSFWVVGVNYPNGKYAEVITGPISPDIYTGGTHIWASKTPESNQINKFLNFTKNFEVPNKIIKAALIYCNVDDKVYFYLNNQYTNCFIPSYLPNGPKVCDVKQYVQVGTNLLFLQAMDTGGGILLSFRLEIILIG